MNEKEEEINNEQAPENTAVDNHQENLQSESDKKNNSSNEVKEFYQKSIQKTDISNNTTYDSTLVGINNGTIYNNYGDLDKYGDPVEFTVIEKVYNQFDVKNETEKFVKILKQDQFLILNCAHTGISDSLRQSIAQHPDFHPCKKFKVASDHCKTPEILDLIDYSVKKIDLHQKDKLLLFIYDTEKRENPYLLKSLKSKLEEGKKDIIEKINDTVFLVYVTYHNEANYLHNSLFDLHYVDTLDIYTRSHGLLSSQIKLLKQQQEKGLWSKDLRDLLRDLDIVKPHFEEAINERSKKKQINFRKALTDKQKVIHRYVLFVACFFPEITLEAFRSFVEILLSKKRSITVDEKEIVFLEIWEEDADMILSDCFLRSYSIDGEFYVGFLSSLDAKRCRALFFESFTNFIDKQTRLLIHEQKLFTEDASMQNHKRMFPIIADLTKYYKNHYGNELIKNWLYRIEDQQDQHKELANTLTDLQSYKGKIAALLETLKKFQFDKDNLLQLRNITHVNLKNQYNDLLKELDYIKFLFFKEEGLPQNASIENVIDELQTLLSSLSDQIDNTARDKNRVKYYLGKNINIFSSLLIEIHDKDASKEIITNFFSSCFKYIYRNLIVLDILNEFHIQSSYPDFFSSYKICLSHSDKKVNEKAFFSLANYLLHPSTNFYQTLKALKDWLPEENTEIKDYTRLESQITKLLYTFLDFQFYRDREIFIKNKTQRSFVYETLFQNDHDMSLFLGLAFSSISRAEFDDNSYQYTFSDTIEYGYVILKKSCKDSIDNTEKITMYIDAIQSSKKQKEYKSLLRALYEKRTLYNEIIANTSNLSYKKETKDKRSYLIELIKLLK